MDVQTLMTGRGCIIGQSGSGKSFLAGVVAEELCKANMPFCVIDTEGEYSSLRSQFNVIVVGGERKDVGLGVDYHKLFQSSMMNDIPVVLDVSDVIDKTEAVYAALDALYKLENEVRKPYLVLIEEADKFAPQVAGKRGNIIEEISVRGRKRGLGLLIATQRPASISKNVLSQCSYGFIGKLTIENDLTAIKILFESRERLVEITRLGVGEFIPFGISQEDAFKVKDRLVKHMGRTPIIEENPVSGRLNSIIRDLREVAGPGMSRTRIPKTSVPITTIKATFGERDAMEYAEKIAKRKFILFGSRVERIDSVEPAYVPMGSGILRIPTSRRNEYTEYTMMMNDRCELVRFDKGIKSIDIEEAGDRYRSYLSKEPASLEKTDADKSGIIKGSITEKKAKAKIGKLLPDSILLDFKIVYLPIYKVTLKAGNTVRVFTIDGLYGKEFEARSV